MLLEPGHQSLFLVNWIVFKGQINQMFSQFNVQKKRDILNMKIILSTSIGNSEHKVSNRLSEALIQVFEKVENTNNAESSIL